MGVYNFLAVRHNLCVLCVLKTWEHVCLLCFDVANLAYAITGATNFQILNLYLLGLFEAFKACLDTA